MSALLRTLYLDPRVGPGDPAVAVGGRRRRHHAQPLQGDDRRGARAREDGHAARQVVPVGAGRRRLRRAGVLDPGGRDPRTAPGRGARRPGRLRERDDALRVRGRRRARRGRSIVARAGRRPISRPAAPARARRRSRRRRHRPPATSTQAHEDPIDAFLRKQRENPSAAAAPAVPAAAARPGRPDPRRAAIWQRQSGTVGPVLRSRRNDAPAPRRGRIGLVHPCAAAGSLVSSLAASRPARSPTLSTDRPAIPLTRAECSRRSPFATSAAGRADGRCLRTRTPAMQFRNGSVARRTESIAKRRRSSPERRRGGSISPREREF